MSISLGGKRIGAKYRYTTCYSKATSAKAIQKSTESQSQTQADRFNKKKKNAIMQDWSNKSSCTSASEKHRVNVATERNFKIRIGVQKEVQVDDTNSSDASSPLSQPSDDVCKYLQGQFIPLLQLNIMRFALRKCSSGDCIGNSSHQQ